MAAIPRFNVSSRFRTTKDDADDSLGSRNHRNDLAVNRSESMRTTASTDSDASNDSKVQLGFANLPDQMHRKAVKKGFNFTLMVVGESGLGKSTLINSLFQQDLYKDREIGTASERVNKTTQIEKRYIELDEKGVKLRLTVVDTPGFNDCINCSECWKPIEDYVDNTFEQYFKDECGLNRKNIIDHRVHCCLYFISPYGHGLRPIDVEFMKRLHSKVNIVPIIAKADTLTSSELKELKEKVMSDLERHKISIYQMPATDSDDDEDTRIQENEIRACLPFAVIGSNCAVDIDNRRVRGRQYPWGIVELENSKHCDFAKLRIFLLGTHMQDLKDITKEVHYENYRAKYITERMSKRKGVKDETFETRKSKNATDAPPFEALVDTEQMMRDKDDEIRRMQSLLSQLQAQKAVETQAAANTAPAAAAATNGSAKENGQ